MKDTILPPPFRLTEGSAMSVPPHFEAFYRATLRFRSGARMRSADLSGHYQAWALAASAPSLGFRAIARAMRALGHRHFHSNGVFYSDVAVASDLPILAEPEAIAVPAIMARLDCLDAELAAIRARVAPSNERILTHG